MRNAVTMHSGMCLRICRVVEKKKKQKKIFLMILTKAGYEFICLSLIFLLNSGTLFDSCDIDNPIDIL